MKKNKAKAIALLYDRRSAPRVVAKGEGRVAKQIVASAKANNIPVHRNEELTALLSGVRMQEEIPQKLYLAVAQILAFLYFINGKNQKNE